MELEAKALLKLDLLNGIDSLGAGEMIELLSESLRATGARRFDDWDKDLQRLADALDEMAKRAKDFEAWYGSREP